MLNGATQKIVTTPKGIVIRKILHRKGTNAEKGALLFQSVLTRQPTDQERALCAKELDDGEGKGFANIVSALVCTPEFLFIY